MKHLEGKTISVLGLGASGLAAARLALAKGGKVYVSDRRVESSVAARGAQLRKQGARVDLGSHDLERMADSDTVVVSPGIPPDAPVLRELRARGIRWISEPEFAFHFLHGALIAVTGTNGKTTTAALTAHLLKDAGFEVGLGGNIGAAFGPAASELALREPAPAWFVVELSSFQLADIVDFSPTIGVVTNLAPDHLDRYEGVDAYYADASSGPRLGGLRVPTLVLASDDDPIIPITMFEPFQRSSRFAQFLHPPHGGHVGFRRYAKPRFWAGVTALDYIAAMTGIDR